MGFLSKITDLFKADDVYEEGYDEGYEEEMLQEEYEEQPQAAARPAPVRATGGIGSSASLEMKVVKPERFEAVTQIGDHLLARRTVVLNLEDTNKETVRRIIDFCSGVAFAIDGQIKRVANSTYIITPKNVDVSGDHPEREDVKPQRELF